MSIRVDPSNPITRPYRTVFILFKKQKMFLCWWKNLDFCGKESFLPGMPHTAVQVFRENEGLCQECPQRNKCRLFPHLVSIVFKRFACTSSRILSTKPKLDSNQIIIIHFPFKGWPFEINERLHDYLFWLFVEHAQNEFDFMLPNHSVYNILSYVYIPLKQTLLWSLRSSTASAAARWANRPTSAFALNARRPTTVAENANGPMRRCTVQCALRP